MERPNQKLLKAAKEAKALIDEMFGVDLILDDTPMAERAIGVQNQLEVAIDSTR